MCVNIVSAMASRSAAGVRIAGSRSTMRSAGLWATGCFQRSEHVKARSRCVQAQAAVAELPSYFSPELVKSVFSTFNGLLLVPWPLMIFFPNAQFTKTFIKSNLPLYVLVAVYAYLFAAATAQSAASGEDVTEQIRYLFLEAVADPDKMAGMFNVPGYAAQDWAHLCIWDYFVGQWIYQQGLEKKVFTGHSLLLTFNTGPFGLMVHYLTEAITLKVRGGSEDGLEAKIEATRKIAAEQREKLAQKAAAKEDSTS